MLNSARGCLRRLWLAAGLLGVTLASGAATVKEVAPADIGRSMVAGKVTVVQFTSSDPKCGYCVGADRAFDTFAHASNVGVQFVRVQWTPWSKFPPMDLSVTLQGIPSVFVFNGQQATAVLMGRPIQQESAWLTAQVDNALAGRALKQFGHVKAPPSQPATAESAAALSDADFSGLRSKFLSYQLGDAVKQCGNLNALLGNALAKAYGQWKVRNPVLADAAVAQLMKTPAAAALKVVAPSLEYEADQQLAKAIAPNDATQAGCKALIAWMEKP